MAYEYFCQFYDELMSDIPYEKYTRLVQKYADKNKKLLDVACGTGTVLISLLKEGYSADGLDISEEMLQVTEKKLKENNLTAGLYEDNMKNISVSGEYGVVYSFLDSINYLTKRTDVQKTFKKIFKALKNNGYFIFDIHALEYAAKVFDGYSYNEINDNLSYMWNTFVKKGEDNCKIYHDLCFFIKEPNGLYKKKEEFHEQNVFTKEFYLEALEAAGFEIHDILYDFHKSGNIADTKKIIIISKKCLL